jgi:1,4-alpha-glucan branching enzyme
MIVRRNGPQSSKVFVTFVLPASIWAERVNVVGDFNAWDPQSLPMTLSDDAWRVTLELEQGHCYHFRYLIDGMHWRADNNADKYAPNYLGEYSSVLQT